MLAEAMMSIGTKAGTQTDASPAAGAGAQVASAASVSEEGAFSAVLAAGLSEAGGEAPTGDLADVLLGEVEEAVALPLTEDIEGALAGVIPQASEPELAKAETIAKAETTELPSQTMAEPKAALLGATAMPDATTAPEAGEDASAGAEILAIDAPLRNSAENPKIAPDAPAPTKAGASEPAPVLAPATVKASPEAIPVEKIPQSVVAAAAPVKDSAVPLAPLAVPRPDVAQQRGTATAPAPTAKASVPTSVTPMTTPAQMSAEVPPEALQEVEPDLARTERPAADAPLGERTPAIRTPAGNAPPQPPTPTLAAAEVPQAIKGADLAASAPDLALTEALHPEQSAQNRASAQVTQPLSLSRAPEFARAVTNQLVAQVRTDPSGPYEIRLDPPELGRIAVRMVSGEGGMIAQITADRQDVLDLLRRTESQIAKDFADAGFEGLAFSFAEGRGEDADQQNADTKVAMSAPEYLAAQETAPNQTTPAIVNGRLDIRL